MNEWMLTGHAFDRLLGFLHTDGIEAARRYEQTRRALIKFFESRGCHTPEEQADKTIDRVAKKVEQGMDAYAGEPVLYFYGVARHVLQEYYRRRSGSLAPLLYIPDDSDHAHRRMECMTRCFEALPEESRSMIVEYCTFEPKRRNELRQRMASRLGISLNTLRIRVHRLRDQLDRCVRGCVAGGDR
ncbi:MAG TPA: hypothetical protein VGF69_13435 [Thermoanaerobaculia bacterium]|jgi:DNA-directed RNA polymerase specialized sigma24 family protein